MPHVITQNCCNDASCVDACPVDCIHPRPDEPDFGTAEMLYIDPERCIDCGACIPMCPVDAIRAGTALEPSAQRYEQLNAFYAAAASAPVPRPEIPLGIPTLAEPLRVAVVGAGPAGLYAAEYLLTRPGVTIHVDVYDRLPTPWGLIRAGVAPDHRRTKDAAEAFRWTARRPGFRYQLGIEVGKDITHAELADHYHAVIYAVGADSDRPLEIPGVELPGSHAATEFVAWYNGHPDYANSEFDLSGSRAVIIGNGNVALDVARILAADPETLSGTDIADYALEALRRSNIREVVVVGRRGAAHAAYTTPELLGLGTIPGVDLIVDAAEVTDAHATGVPQLKVDVNREIAQRTDEGNPRRIVLRYLLSPVEIIGDFEVEGIRLVYNEYRSDIGSGAVAATDRSETIDAGLVLRSVGYRGRRLPGLPFDEIGGVIPNDGGRVEPGTYACGWIKRGPSGVIGTNKKCARETVDALLDDAQAGRLSTPGAGRTSLDQLLDARVPNRIGAQGWGAIDWRERSAGREQGRPRVKLTHFDDLYEVASTVEDLSSC